MDYRTDSFVSGEYRYLQNLKENKILLVIIQSNIAQTETDNGYRYFGLDYMK